VRARSRFRDNVLDWLVEQTVDPAFLALDSCAVNVEAHVQDINVAAEAQRNPQRLIQDGPIIVGSIDTYEDVLDARMGQSRRLIGRLERPLRGVRGRRVGLAA
jgi:hypothetical protein